MAESSARLVDSVLPHVPIRQWVLSVPWTLRYAMARDQALCKAVALAFLRAVSSSYRRRAACAIAEPGPRLESPLDRIRIEAGAINFVQRFSPSLGLNVHFHALFLDGVHVTRGVARTPQFHAAPPLTGAELARVHRDARRRIERVLQRFGFELDLPDALPPSLEPDPDDALPLFQAASIRGCDSSGNQVPRVLGPVLGSKLAIPPPPPPLVHDEAGFSLHAGTAVAAEERNRLESLIRYVTRPPISLDRLEVLPNGKVKWTMKRPWRDGTCAFLFDPMTFLERLAALVPHPREHLVTYFGSLAPAASIRSAIVPADRRSASDDPCPASAPEPGQTRILWPELLRRTFGARVFRCPTCGSKRFRLAVITEPGVIKRILRAVGMHSEPEPLAAARPPPDSYLPY